MSDERHEIRYKTLAEICDIVHALIPGAAVRVTRADRHAPQSRIDVVIVEFEQSLGFMVLTQVAGAFETPHIEVSAEPNEEMIGDITGAELRLRITWGEP